MSLLEEFKNRITLPSLSVLGAMKSRSETKELLIDPQSSVEQVDETKGHLEEANPDRDHPLAAFM